MNERIIANRALEQLRFQTGLVGHVSRSEAKSKKKNSNKFGGAEAVVKFESIKGQLVAHLSEGAITGRALTELIEATQGHDNLIICDYINDEDAERFRESNINYLDNVGNAYLNLPPVYVFIQGKKPRDSYTSDRAAKLFTETGLRVIMALLCHDDLLNASYRRIADHAGVSMGTIGWVLRELKNQGFIGTRKSRFAWLQRVKLVKKWSEEYPNLREKYSVGTYFTQDLKWWQESQLDVYDAVLGGEVSSGEQIEGFTPRHAEVFIAKHKHTQLIKDLDLIPEAEIARLGNKVNESNLARIDLVNKFWGVDEHNDLFSKTVHPLLTYACLMDSWDPKSRELAAKIARQFI
ncbi:MAG: hypothetical protein KTR16_08860 [Acidiferrobacterales bacterium]|nr:hypothetical protein [Acidiferrobacterales bacterium]